jgi:phytoene desaturase
VHRALGKSVIIIGAGLAGLSAGCYARINGYRCHIFEHHSSTGGVAAAWKRKDYLIDGGIHFITGFKQGSALDRFYKETGITTGASIIEMSEYGRFVDELSGRHIDVTKNIDRLDADLKSLSPEDSDFIDGLMKGIRAFRHHEMGEFGLEKPPEMSTPLDSVKLMWSIRSVFKYFSGRYTRSIEEYVRDVSDPLLSDFLRYLFLPGAPVWFIFMLLALLADGQMGLLEGGCREFVGLLEGRYRQLDGEITCKATVKEILVENQRAVGVKLEDGTEQRADFVISAADGYSTIFEMLGGRYINEKITTRYREWPLFQPAVTISYGVAREFKGEPSSSIITLEHPFNVGTRSIDSLMVRVFNYSDRFAPSGKTVLQVMFDSDWDYWHNLQSEKRAAYLKEKSRIAAEVLERLQRHYPGIAAQVEVTDVATPYTTWRYTLNHRGSPEGWLLQAELIMEQIERKLPGLSGFFMAGQWVMPGGGVVPCLYSGRHAVQLLCHEDKKRFHV